MDAIEVIKILGEMNTRFRLEELDYAILYFVNMIKDERVIVITENNVPHGVLTFSLTDCHEAFLKKQTWDYLPHNLLAKTIYIEKLFSKGWNKELRVLFEKMITARFPHVEQGLWYRWARWGDRCVITKRRLQDVRNQSA